MQVILTTPAEVDRWLSEETPVALELQRPLPDDALRIVAKGERADGAPLFGRTGMTALDVLLPLQTSTANVTSRQECGHCP